MKKIILALISLIYIQVTQLNAQDSDCIFSSEVIKESYLKDYKEVRMYHWNDTTKEAQAILNDGSLLYFEGYFCDLSGHKVINFIYTYNYDASFLYKKIMSLASNFFELDFEYFEQGITEKNLHALINKIRKKQRVEINLNSYSMNSYRDFYVAIEKSEALEITLRYSMD